MKFRHFFFALALGLAVLPSAFAADFVSSVQNGLFKQNAIWTSHFQFEYSDLIADQADEDGDGIPDTVEVLADAAERSWDILVEEMGYQRPNNESRARVLVILDDTDEYLIEGSVGVTTVQSNEDAIIAINPWLSEDYLQITMAHEFFHSIQFGYDISFSSYGQGINWAESTAVWVEDVVYDASNDYVNYYDDFFSYVDYSIFASISPSDTLYTYALNIWPKFLSEYYNDNTIKVIWESYFESSASYADNLKIYDAVNDYVTAQGDDLGEVFQEFTLWNLALDSYEEGDLYPGVYYLDGFAGEGYVDADELFAPALFGTNYLYFQNTGESQFRFHLVRPQETRYAVTLVPLNGSLVDLEGAQRTILAIGEEMEEEMVLELKPSQDVMVVLSPLEIDFDNSLNEYVFDEGYLYSYMADFGAALSGDIESDGGVVESTPDEKAGEDATQTDEVRNILTLKLKDYDESSVTVAWNRIPEDAIAGYQLSYGTETGNYEFSKLVDVPHITIKTVSELLEGATYYFQLQALNANGDVVGEPSTELAVTLEKWIFTDLSYLDVHFDSISSLTELGVFQGYPDGSFKPEAPITRAELVKILVEGQDITPDETQYNSCFTDVANEWYAKYLCYAKAQGWIRGYDDGGFHPNSTVSKVEALKILFEIYGVDLEEGTSVESLPYLGLPTNEWYSIYVWEAARLGILEETPGTDFLPNKGRTRSEMAEELYRYLVVNELAS